MAGYEIKPAKLAGQTFWPIVRGRYDSAAVFRTGAILILGADGELEEGGTDPTAIVGVALEPANSSPGYEMGHNPSVITWRAQEVSYTTANRSTIFAGRGVNGGTDPVTPTQTQIGENFGLTKDATNTWVIDISDTSNTRVRIVDIDVEQRIYFFKFLEAALGAP